MASCNRACAAAETRSSPNLTKSHLEPAQRVTYLGVDLDSAAMTAHLSSRRVSVILDSLAPFRGGRVVPYRQVLHLVCRLAAASSVVPLGLLQLRPLQRWVNVLHLDAGRHRHRRVRVSQQCVLALAPWRLQAFLSQGVPMGSIPSRREIVTVDACPRGWGSVWQRRTAQGLWSPQDSALHINVLELRAIRLALEHFPHERKRCCYHERTGVSGSTAAGN
ncbi:uncharacterized protein LOC117497598 [Scomber scombrus]|uniref:Uncharacterized protein LOC117497598 n=1 Tax=Scomber scombrus TaxID=13677 RepID=A0AAV1PHH8_SCOSC